MEMVEGQTKVCEFCGDILLNVDRSTKRVRFCSVKCSAQSRSKKVDRACIACGCTFQAKQSVIDRGEGLFCTRKCYTLNKDVPKVAIIVQRDTEEKSCKSCGCVFTVPAKYALQLWSDFCSESCLNKPVEVSPS